MDGNKGMTDVEFKECLDKELSFEEASKAPTNITKNSSTNTEVENNSAIDYEEENQIYCFPNEDERFIEFLKRFEKVSDEKINKAFLIISGIGKVKQDKEHYSKIRIEFCAIHYILNQRGLIAPIFRDLRRVTKNQHLTNSEKLLSKDRMVVDSHYLNCNYKGKVIPKRGEYKALLTDDKFDFSLAASFAVEKWGAVKKAEKLNVTENIQKELLVFRSKKITEELRRFPKHIDDFETHIKELASQPGSRIDMKAIPQRIIEFKCLKLANGAPSEAARYWQKLTGEKLDKQQSGKMMKRLSERKKWLKEKMELSF